MARLMEKVLSKQPKVKKRLYDDGHELYQVAVYSVCIEQQFRELLGNPPRKKSLNFRVPVMIRNSKPLSRKFIQGMFEAEGSFRLWRGKPRVQMDIYNKNAARFIHKTIRSDGIKVSLSVCSDGACRIETTSTKNVELMKQLYHFPSTGKSQL